MSRFVRKLLREIHRRSVWQVAGVYLLIAWSVWEGIRRGTASMGLPDWTPAMTLTLLAIGLPMVIGTAIVQRGVPELRGEYRDEVDPMELEGLTPDQVLKYPTPNPFAGHTIFTWRNAVLGGVGGAALLAGSVSAYLTMWSLGIGPVGNLVAAGELRPGSRLLLADFSDASAEGLGGAVTEGLRLDLENSDMVDVVDRALGPEALAGTAARRRAREEGIPLLLEGEVERRGAGYRVTASLRAVREGVDLATFRATARGTEGLVAAVDRLAQDVREKMGESLRSIREDPRLVQAATPSPRALGLLSEAQASMASGDFGGAAELLEQAVAIDPDFALAWSALARAHTSAGLDPGRAQKAAERAFELRDRMTPAATAIAEGRYHGSVTHNHGAAADAYLRALNERPSSRAALSELARVYAVSGRHVEAAALRRRLAEDRLESPGVLRDLVEALLAAGSVQAAAEIVDRWEGAYPDDPEVELWRGWVAWARGDVAAAEEAFVRLADPRGPGGGALGEGHAALGWLALWRGRLAESRLHFVEAERLAAETDRTVAWARRIDGARASLVTGQEEWAVLRLASALDDGTWENVPRARRRHAEVALILALGGDPGSARRVIADYEAGVAEGVLAARDPGMRRAELAVSFAFGDTAGVLQALADETRGDDCAPCWNAPRAWMHEAAGQLRESADLYGREITSAHVPYEATVALRTLATQRLGPLLDQLGDTAGAIAAYRRLADQWDAGDASARPQVQRALQRITALERGAP